MFFFIGGIQPKTVLIDRQARSCPACGHFEIHQKRVDQYVSLFFIPLFPVKKGIPFSEPPIRKKRCPSCGRKVDPNFTFCPYCGKAL
jgi:rRNA maturation endonuclease Nob1